MAIAIVRSVVKRFLKDPLASVLVIRGKWGTGKTYFWKSYVADHHAESSRHRYSYVSLFGISSIKDLQVAAFVNTVDINATSTEISGLSIKSIGRTFATRVGDVFPGLLGKSASFAIETMAPHLIRDALVCLDDFERLPTDGIQFEEVLGFVSSLKEEKNCKVVLIFNDKELQDRAEIYLRYREKVIDVEVLFEPTADDAADIALPADIPFREKVREKLQVLAIGNIRLIRKIVNNIRLVYPVANVGQDWIAQSVVLMTVLLTWIEYGSDSDPPTLDFLRKWNKMAHYAERGERSKKKPNTEEEKAEKQRIERWSEVLDKYDLMSFSACDAALERALSAGYVEGSGLDLEVGKLKDDDDASEVEARFTKGWRLYHDSYEDNQAEIIAIFDRNFDAAAPKMSPGNVDATVRLLRNFGEAALADKLIERYIRIREGETRLFDPDKWYGEPIKDKNFKERIAEHYSLSKQPPSLIEVLKVFAGRKGWSTEQMDMLKAASAEDLYQAFRSNPKSDSFAKICLEFAADPQLKHIAENATVALKRIAGESLINRLRVESKFDISLDQTMPNEVGGD
jgi:hypothetical protein